MTTTYDDDGPGPTDEAREYDTEPAVFLDSDGDLVVDPPYSPQHGSCGYYTLPTIAGDLRANIVAPDPRYDDASAHDAVRAHLERVHPLSGRDQDEIGMFLDRHADVADDQRVRLIGGPYRDEGELTLGAVRALARLAALDFEVER